MSIGVVEGRLLVVRELIDRLETAVPLAGVEVWEAFPGEKTLAPDMMWFGELTGDVQIPVMTGADNRHLRDDQWSAGLHVRTVGNGGLGPRDAARRAQDRLAVMCDAVDGILADDPTIDESITLVDATLTRPSQLVVSTPEGTIGWAEMQLSFHSRLH